MDIRLYVGNLSYGTAEDDLQNLFSQAGTVKSVDLIKDRMTGSSKGFAFVQMSTQEEADKAIRMFNGYKLDNRELKVSIARPREETGPGGFGGARRTGGGFGRDKDNRGERRGGGGQRRY